MVRPHELLQKKYPRPHEQGENLSTLTLLSTPVGHVFRPARVLERTTGVARAYVHALPSSKILLTGYTLHEFS